MDNNKNELDKVSDLLQTYKDTIIQKERSRIYDIMFKICEPCLDGCIDCHLFELRQKLLKQEALGE